MNYHQKNMNKREQFLQKGKKIVLENEISFPSMTEESSNEEHADKNENVTKTCIYHTKGVK